MYNFLQDNYYNWLNWCDKYFTIACFDQTGTINTSTNAKELQMATTKFESSAEAMAHMQQIEKLLDDPRLAQFLQATDRNFSTNNVAGQLNCIRCSFRDMYIEVLEAE